MSLDQLLNQVTFKLASEIGDQEIVCRIQDYKIKVDRHGRKMLQLMLKCKGHGTVIVALSPSYAKEFGARLKKLGVEKISDMMSVCFIWEKFKPPKAREDYTDPYPRFLPKEAVPCPEELMY